MDSVTVVEDQGFYVKVSILDLLTAAEEDALRAKYSLFRDQFLQEFDHQWEKRFPGSSA